MKINKDILILSYIYLARIYTAIIAVVMIPFLIKILGTESYGLIGYFVVVQACLSIFDAGIGGVLTRQAILSKDNRNDFDKFIKIFYKAVILFFCISAFIWLCGQFFSNSLVGMLNSTLSKETISKSIALMLMIFAVKYFQGPFRSILLASERQVLLTTLNVIYMTLSQVAVYYFLIYSHSGILLYFKLQLLFSALNSAMIIYFGLKTLTIIKKNIKSTEQFKGSVISTNFRTMLLFAFQLSVLSILWVMVNQSDKLTLAKYLPLDEYAHYTIAISFVSMLSVLSDPLNQFLQPRLTGLYHGKDYQKYSRILSRSFDFILLLTMPLSIFLFFYSQELVYIWAKDYPLAIRISNYLPWLFMGGVFAVYSNFVFLVLYSIGKLKLHTIVYATFSIVIVPMNFYFAKFYLGEGTSRFYLLNSVFLFIVWGGYVFNKYFNKGLHLIYLKMLPLVLINVLYFICINNVNIKIWMNQPYLLFLIILSFGLIAVSISLCYLLIINKFSKPIEFWANK
ncbi:oligosaccharide flippase family protein [Leclercia sp.]|uniref:lipopolysaccharide biosynthesis protein n=1 Tax=Leclercia sp. TaxID=1898428 RepID=UPI00289D84A8|nr:oligosaccharide flippase family protein [Leclercia sp.]